MSVPSAHIVWALDKVLGKEHVSFANFVRRFDLSDEESATRAFELLLESPNIRSHRREKMKKAFKDFQDNNRSKFWAERALQVNTEVAVNRAGIVMQDAGVIRAKMACEQFFSSSGGGSVDQEVLEDSEAEDKAGGIMELHKVSPKISPSEREGETIDNDDDADAFNDVDFQHSPAKDMPPPDPKRRRASEHEEELCEENTTLFGQSRSPTWHDEDPTTPPSLRPRSPSHVHQHHELRSGSPADTPLTEEDISEQKAALVSLNQQDTWIVDGVDLLSKFDSFKNQQPQGRFSLALDGIADVTPGSAFSLYLSQEERALAITTSVKDINERWRSLSSILSRVCARSHSYDDVVEALDKEDASDRVVKYLQAITYNYSHYLQSSDQVPRNLNEREGFADLTWPFIRGALRLVNIQTRCFEIPVIGTKERRNHRRDLYVETEEQASMADGVALFEDHQIYLAEASLIHEAKMDKEVKDKFKVVRCMRDSWNSQIRSIARESVPPTGLTVFGSTSFEDETKFYGMDFAGMYRLRQVGRMLVPLRRSHFATRMETCVKTCLRFALDLQEETVRRIHLVSTNEDLSFACDMIEQTRTTPTKEVKRRRVSGIY
ncbi:hypothetical protein BGX29_001651 [Mortierella sp. GBA35]|nr:hypothetical protein BGX29_001651 [Mortierella sp. GBA35]